MKASPSLKTHEPAKPPGGAESHIYEDENNLKTPEVNVYERPEEPKKSSKIALYVIGAVVIIALLAYLL